MGVRSTRSRVADYGSAAPDHQRHRRAGARAAHGGPAGRDPRPGWRCACADGEAADAGVPPRSASADWRRGQHAAPGRGRQCPVARGRSRTRWPPRSARAAPCCACALGIVDDAQRRLSVANASRRTGVRAGARRAVDSMLKRPLKTLPRLPNWSWRSSRASLRRRLGTVLDEERSSPLSAPAGPVRHPRRWPELAGLVLRSRRRDQPAAPLDRHPRVDVGIGSLHRQHALDAVASASRERRVRPRPSRPALCRVYQQQYSASSFAAAARAAARQGGVAPRPRGRRGGRTPPSGARHAHLDVIESSLDHPPWRRSLVGRAASYDR